MDIKDIKAQLSISQVLQHYNLKADKNNKLCCPFHEDKSPSLQIYPKTNTYCCFSANCAAGTGDSIQFIQLKENCSKHEALTKATALLNNTTTKPSEPKLIIQTEPLEKIAVFTKLFKYFTKSLPLTKKAVDYTESRAMNYKVHEIGFNTGDWHHKLNEKNFITAAETIGLLKARAANGFNVWAKDCIIFPLKNIDNKIYAAVGKRPPVRMPPLVSPDQRQESHFRRCWCSRAPSGSPLAQVFGVADHLMPIKLAGLCPVFRLQMSGL